MISFRCIQIGLTEVCNDAIRKEKGGETDKHSRFTSFTEFSVLFKGMEISTRGNFACLLPGSETYCPLYLGNDLKMLIISGMLPANSA